jgi:subtilase family serine protease
MGIRHHGDRPTRRTWPAIVIPIALLAGAGVLAGTPAAVVAGTPAATSTPVSSPVEHGCGTSFTPGQANCLLIKNTAAHPAAQTVGAAAIPAGTGFGPSDLRSAYNLISASGADGKGTTVAVVDAYNDQTAASDLAFYRSAAGLPALTSGQFTVYNQEGQTAPLPAAAPPDSNGDWTEEESLDVDMVSAICPLCKIDLVEADDATAVNLLVADAIAATSLGARYISDSWGFSELSADTTLDSAVFSVPGVVYVAGAGETGYAGGVVYPAASPNVVSVGGTTLATAANSRGWTESVWNTLGVSSGAGATGSGCSAYEPQPSWQKSVSIISSACPNRVENDVAADADPSTGVAIYDNSDGNTGWLDVAGTSEATAIIAAVFALAGNDGNGGNNAAHSIYANPGHLNEVTASDNGTCTPPAAASVLCTATGAASTYNGPTGWGTPDDITAFQSIGNTVVVNWPGDQTGTVGTAISNLQISAIDSVSTQTLTYTAAGLPAGLSISSAGLISGTPKMAGASVVTVTATDTAGGSGSETFIWTISPAASSSPSPSATLPTSASPTPTSTSATTAISTSATATPSASATPAPAASASSTSPAPAPSPISSNLAVTG